MLVVTIGMILEVNQKIRERQLPYKVHLSDACGRQSMWIEALDGSLPGDNPEVLYEVINSYFKEQHIRLEYSPDGFTFWTIS